MQRRSFVPVGAAIAAAAFLARVGIRRSTTFDLRGKVVLVTGGSRGLGLVMARELVARGARVAICARDVLELERALAELDGVIAIPCDLTERGDLERLVAEVHARLGPIDVLINNAGIIQVGPVEHMTEADYRRAMDTHLWAPLYLIESVVPDMIARGGGRIVNITSIGGKIAVPHLLPYTASKFALVGLSEGLHAELARHGIAVTTVVPGLMRTGSAVNARFKGQHRAEYAWFATGASTSLTAMRAERAAHQIIRALCNGTPEIVLSPQAKLAVTLAALAPNLIARLLGLVARLLPAPGGIGEREASGADSRWVSWLTRASDRAAIRNNEI